MYKWMKIHMLEVHEFYANCELRVRQKEKSTQ